MIFHIQKVVSLRVGQVRLGPIVNYQSFMGNLGNWIKEEVPALYINPPLQAYKPNRLQRDFRSLLTNPFPISHFLSREVSVERTKERKRKKLRDEDRLCNFRVAATGGPADRTAAAGNGEFRRRDGKVHRSTGGAFSLPPLRGLSAERPILFALYFLLPVVPSFGFHPLLLRKPKRDLSLRYLTESLRLRIPRQHHAHHVSRLSLPSEDSEEDAGCLSAFSLHRYFESFSFSFFFCDL